MANDFNYLRGNLRQIRVPILTGDVIEVGDFIVRDDGQSDAYISATDSTFWDTDEATTVGQAKDDFVGVAMQSSATGETAEITLNIDGVYSVAATSDSYLLGALVSLTKGGGNALVSIFEDGTAADSFARVAKQAAASSTVIEIEIFSTVVQQGVTTATT